MPVKGHQADIQTVDDDAQYGPGRRPFDYFQVFLTHANGIKKARQRNKADQFHQIPDSIRCPQQVPVVALLYPDHFNDKIAGQNQRSGFAESQGDIIFFF